jgi:uncharacterized protein DUF6487
MADLLPPACPRCGQPMQPGFAALINRMNWVERIGVFDASVFKGETMVPMPLVGAAHIPGFRCASCRIATLDYGNLIP